MQNNKNKKLQKNSNFFDTNTSKKSFLETKYISSPSFSFLLFLFDIFFYKTKHTEAAADPKPGHEALFKTCVGNRGLRINEQGIFHPFFLLVVG